MTGFVVVVVVLAAFVWFGLWSRARVGREQRAPGGIGGAGGG